MRICLPVISRAGSSLFRRLYRCAAPFERKSNIRGRVSASPKASTCGPRPLKWGHLASGPAPGGALARVKGDTRRSLEYVSVQLAERLKFIEAESAESNPPQTHPP